MLQHREWAVRRDAVSAVSLARYLLDLIRRIAAPQRYHPRELELCRHLRVHGPCAVTYFVLQAAEDPCRVRVSDCNNQTIAIFGCDAESTTEIVLPLDVETYLKIECSSPPHLLAVHYRHGREEILWGHRGN
jgi:hypothetical protein